MVRRSTDVLNRHKAFWERRPTDRPLLGINVGFTLPQTFPRTMAEIGDGALQPDDIPLKALFQDCDALELVHRGLGDYPYVAAPFVGVPWLEAIAGCPVAAHRTGFWAEPCVKDWRSWRWQESFLDNPWTRKLQELMAALTTHVWIRFCASPTM